MSTSKTPASKKKSTDNVPATTTKKNDVPAEKEADIALVEKAYEKLSTIIIKHLSEAMNEVGDYLIKEFYADDYKRVHSNSPVKEQSLNQLIQKLHQNEESSPSKTWIYNAVNLVADERYFQEIAFSVYGNLGRSHKVYLTHVRNMEEKKKLIEESVKKNYTVARLREEIAKLKKSRAKYTFELLSDKTALIGLSLKKLQGWKTKTEKDIEKLTGTLEQYVKAKENLLATIQEKEIEKKKNDEMKEEKKKVKEEKKKEKEIAKAEKEKEKPKKKKSEKS